MNFDSQNWDPNMDFQNHSKDQIDQMRRHMAALSKKYIELFQSNAGKDILEDLRQRFLHDATWVNGMAFQDVTYMEGQRSVITYINRILNFKYEPINE